ncbi:NtaA/DmoA family FMN-dependent monooxygenase [Arthrobacter sp. NPDC056886]|uniref:NtaA/DmoA family FMN-dependent monooxygenase n=1 Tax=Arthrobacter sp. NPDC056886 TaxID=3345960 RepID=UPI00366F732E
MTRRQAHLNAMLIGSGYHESAWLVQDHDPVELASFEHLQRSALTAERGLLDSIFFADTPNLTLFRAAFFPQIFYDPVVLLAAVGAVTQHIGLFATASTTYNSPYELARRFLTADHTSGGRVGWNVVTTADAKAAKNFGVAEHPEHDDRYARAGEFVDVVQRLWHGWEDGAILGDRRSRRWADVARIHPADFHGTYFDVAGALPIPPSPQGSPVIAQAGSSPAGVDLAARVADVVFTPQPTIAAGKSFRSTLEAAARRHGRPVDDIRILPGLAFVLGSTEAEAASTRLELEESADPELRWRNVAHNAGMNMTLIDPSRPLSDEAAATAELSTIGKYIVAEAQKSGEPFGEVARRMTGLPGGLDFTGTPEQMADLIEDWVSEGGSDGFTLQPTMLPDSLDLFVDHVVPLLQKRGLHRTEYEGSTLRSHLGLPAGPEE